MQTCGPNCVVICGSCKYSYWEQSEAYKMRCALHPENDIIYTERGCDEFKCNFCKEKSNMNEYRPKRKER